MNPASSFRFALGLLGLAGALFASNSARADLTYLIDIDTSSIVNHTAGPFYIDFQSIYGSGLAQTFTVSQVSFVSGGLTGNGTATGAVSGDLATTLTLGPSATNPYNDFFQGFDSTVSNITLTINLTTNTSGLTPTSFSISLLDNNIMNIPTSGVGDSLLLVNIDGMNNPLQIATGMGVTLNVTAVPEPSTYGLVGAAAVVGAVFMRRRRSK